LTSLDKVYYTRIALGVIAGAISGFIIAPEFDHETSVGIALGVAATFFGISLGISRSITKNMPKEVKKKSSYDGFVPFIFMNFVFMILVYTAIHQASILK
jgi:hypothetical protein